MPIHWKLRLTCDDCGVEIVYEDQKPEWKQTQRDEEAYEKARAFVEEIKHVNPFGDEALPEYVGVNPLTGKVYLRKFVPLDYVECPACGGCCYKGTKA